MPRSPGRPRRAGRVDSSASSWFSPTRWCDRWHHSSNAQEPRDYTKGLGQLGGNGRKSFVLQGWLQGSIRAARGERGPVLADVLRPVGRRPTGRMWSCSCALRCDGIERAADDAQLVADLGPEIEQSDDCDDGDKCKDEGIFREALALFAMMESIDKCEKARERGHVAHLLSSKMVFECLVAGL